MDISAGTVSADPNLTGRIDPGMNTNIYYLLLYLLFIIIYYVLLLARPVFHGEHVLDSFNMVISWIILVVNTSGLQIGNNEYLLF